MASARLLGIKRETDLGVWILGSGQQSVHGSWKSGSWRSGCRMPRCQRWKYLDKVVCDQLTNPAYGTVVYSDRRFEDTATYSCNCGYELDGCSKRTCLSDGTWSGNAPTCRGEFLLHLGQSFLFFVLRTLPTQIFKN